MKLFPKWPVSAILTKRSVVPDNYRDTRKFTLEPDRVAFAEWLGKAVTSIRLACKNTAICAPKSVVIWYD